MHAFVCSPVGFQSSAGVRRNFAASNSTCCHPRLQMALPSRPSKRLVVLECGSGADLHGQDATKAAMRACRNAVEFNSLPVLAELCEDGDLSNMLVKVKLGVPEDLIDTVNMEKVQSVFPYGEKKVEVVVGGLMADSGIELPDQDDNPGDTRAVIVVAAVSVLC